MVATEQALVTDKQLDLLSINTIRTLAIDAVQQANSGHPGAVQTGHLAQRAHGLAFRSALLDFFKQASLPLTTAGG